MERVDRATVATPSGGDAEKSLDGTQEECSRPAGEVAKAAAPPRTESEMQERMREMARLQYAKEERLTYLLGRGDKAGLTLMKNISKDTFDDIVRENMEEFGMEHQEAIDDAIKQLGMQTQQT